MSQRISAQKTPSGGLSVTGSEVGTLYIVATPIGNLADMTERAVNTLKQVDLIACEDTRHTSKLLHHLAIQKPLVAVHDHNESEKIEWAKKQLDQGKNIALVSDAGTPLISDPGFVLVRALRELGCQVQPVPGVSAIITALSAAGLATDRFTFEGFLPHKSGAKKEKLEAVLQEPRTLVYYESKHRILDTLKVMAELFGDQRRAVVARELTKTFESYYQGNFSEIHQQLSENANQQKGEFVIMISGNDNPQSDSSVNQEKLFKLLLAELPPKKAAAIVAEVTGQNKKDLYQQALEMKNQ